MDKSQIQERTKKLLEKAEKPEEFTKGLQGLLKSYQPKSILNVQKHIDGGWFWVKYLAFPYLGCQYGCEYCYWRDEKYNPHKPSRAPEVLEFEDAFSQYIKIKENAGELFLQDRETQLSSGINYKYWALQKAAWAIDELNQDIKEIYKKQGKKGLLAIKGVGESIVKIIAEFLENKELEEVV